MAIVLWKLLRVKGDTPIVLEQENRNQNYSGQIKYTVILVMARLTSSSSFSYAMGSEVISNTCKHTFKLWCLKCQRLANAWVSILFINPRKWAYCVCKPWETNTSQPFQRDRKFLLIHHPPGVRTAQNCFLKICSFVWLSLQDRPWLLPTTTFSPSKHILLGNMPE